MNSQTNIEQGVKQVELNDLDLDHVAAGKGGLGAGLGGKGSGIGF